MKIIAFLLILPVVLLFVKIAMFIRKILNAFFFSFINENSGLGFLFSIIINLTSAFFAFGFLILIVDFIISN